MNLMDVLSCKWDPTLLDICGGPELAAKLGPEPVYGGTTLGNVSAYWVERWGFSPDCLVAPFTGDNPATVVALSAPGDALLSLGTSTTLLLSIPPEEEPPKRFTTSHLLAHPTTRDGQIAMLCYKNGALARDGVRDKYAAGHWEDYNTLVEKRPPGNDGVMGFYFPLPEIIPPGVQGEFFFSYNREDPSTPIEQIDHIPDEAHARAILESQFLSIKARIAAIMPPSAPPLQRMVMSGGGSANPVIRQLAADVFGMRVYVAGEQGAAAGGAGLARFAWWRKMNGGRGTYEELCASDLSGLREVAKPKADVTEVYAGLVDVYRRCEEVVVKTCGIAV